jgi:hypothetical protein
MSNIGLCPKCNRIISFRFPIHHCGDLKEICIYKGSRIYLLKNGLYAIGYMHDNTSKLWRNGLISIRGCKMTISKNLNRLLHDSKKIVVHI